jgi:Arc/MetJ-type ribon-helix-helix transcriptional regulator
MDLDRQNVGQRLADSEKITINLGFVDLGHIDLLVAESFFANRTDLIRTAIRNLLERHSQALQQSASRRHLVLGLRRYSRGELELARAASEAFNIRVLGLAIIDPDVSTELALATIASIEVLGALQASKDVKRALRDRIR